ncbi:MAG: hypothetical protein ACXW5U_01460 [Thermoanaerobaculia bacterium]
MPVGRLERRVVNYVALSASIGAVLLGFLVLYLASKDDIFFTHPNVREVTREVGAVVVVTGLLTIFWELIAKRSFAEELLARVGTGKEIAASGLVGVTPNFHRDIDWPDLFRNTRELDIFFAYGGTWRNSHLHELQAFVRQDNARLRVVLPDSDDPGTVGDLARRFGIPDNILVQRITDSEAAFRDLGGLAECRAHIEVWRLARTPVFSLYRFDNVIVAALYHHRRNRDPVPAFTAERPGTLFEFFGTEFDAIVDSSAQLLFCNRGHAP